MPSFQGHRFLAILSANFLRPARTATLPDDSGSTPGVCELSTVDTALAPPESPSTLVGFSELEKLDSMTVAHSPYGAWQGVSDCTPNILKVYRYHSSSHLREVKEVLEKRVPKWKMLNHPNIVPFLGAYLSSSDLSIAYPRGWNGNLKEYMTSHPEAPRMPLLLDVASGLTYLHSLNIPHGNVKGANVIINRMGHALLTEYGLAPIVSSPSLTTNATPDAVRNCRWMSPELIDPFQKPVGTSVLESKPADVYAFGMVVYEILTGRVPFEGQSDEAVVLRILRGERPEMPANAHAMALSGKTWKLLEGCWYSNPKKRPMMKEVMSRCERFIGDDIVTKEPLPPAEIGAVEVNLPRKISPPPPKPKCGRKSLCGLA